MPYGAILNVIVIGVFIFAFIKAESKGKIILATIIAILIILPQIVKMTPLGWVWWIHYIAKIIFGLCCLVYINWLKR